MVSAIKVLFAAIIGALIGAVLSLVPFLNYICCLPTLLGGFTSAALVGVMAGNEKLQTTDGFVSGGLAGFLQALLVVMVLALVSIAFGGLYLGLGALVALGQRSIEPLLVLGGMGAFASIVMLLVTIFVAIIYFVLYSVVGGIGGTIAGALMFKKS